MTTQQDLFQTLTGEECEEILSLTGVDVMAPPGEVSFTKRYCALSFYKRYRAGEKTLSFAEVLRAPMRKTVDDIAASGSGVDPTNRAAKRAAVKKPAAKSSPVKRSGSAVSSRAKR